MSIRSTNTAIDLAGEFQHNRFASREGRPSPLPLRRESRSQCGSLRRTAQLTWPKIARCKKRMHQSGTAEIPQSAFIALRMGDG
jgi:hypothetical protein